MFTFPKSTHNTITNDNTPKEETTSKNSTTWERFQPEIPPGTGARAPTEKKRSNRSSTSKIVAEPTVQDWTNQSAYRLKLNV